jgi:hypothetical protein
MKKIKRKIAAVFSITGLALAIPLIAVATILALVVTPSNTQGWQTDIRGAAEINYIDDNTSPYAPGVLQIKTTSSNIDKAQYLKSTSTPLAQVTDLSYQTKQVSGPSTAAASYQLEVDLNGAADGGNTTLVYEPHWNGPVVPSAWQSWDVDAGRLWSSETVADGACSVDSATDGEPQYTLAQIKVACPNAIVQAYGINVGGFNPNFNVEVDGVQFNNVFNNFERSNLPKSKDDCKKDGYKNFTDADGNPFKSQGQCMSSAGKY